MPGKRAGTVSVMVVDDHRTFAEALALAIKLEKDMAVYVATGGSDAVAKVGVARPDVVLMDLDLPGQDGVDAIRRIRDANPRTRVVVLSAHEDEVLRAQAVEAGAVGILSKLTSVSEVPDAVRRASRGEQMMDQHEVDRLLRMLRRRRHQEATERQRVSRLTPRQTEVLQLIADGVPVRDIAERLGMSLFTLRTHVQNALMRLGAHTKAEALSVAIRHGKISARSKHRRRPSPTNLMA